MNNIWNVTLPLQSSKIQDFNIICPCKYFRNQKSEKTLNQFGIADKYLHPSVNICIFCDSSLYHDALYKAVH